MPLLSWLWAKKVPGDTEVLEAIADSIRTRGEHLSEIRLREKRASFLFLLYSVGAWGVYLAAWFTSVLPSLEGHQTLWNWKIPKSADKVIFLTPAVLGPLFIYQIRRLVQAWYKRQETLEEAELKKLRTQQKKKLEEIKAKYNFDKIRALVDSQPDTPRRDDPNANLRQRAITMNPRPSVPARPLSQRPQQPFDPRAPPMLQVPASGPPMPVVSPQRGWLDKVADKVLGEDESPLGVAQSRYALICERCFSHNGLVKENDWETTQYICPKCGHMNLSPKTKKTGIPTSPYLTVPPTPIAGLLSHTPHLTVPPTPIAGFSHTHHSPAPDSSEPPSQDQPSQDQDHPSPDEMKMELDSSSS
ncbi:unnamed protein product [Rhizoctonia solani]|uniref:Endoplasmic reticulum junction formation protein lunapark n=1 Tax=Rhizoctonia solani TaxID=456999 RepID=A0A8H3EE89_9AGAM|nr:unnamed protein product [Rhizoctonia solani]